MKISTKGIYALEAMIDLGLYSKENVESIKNIAVRRKISEKYLEQIISALKKAGLIKSTRGAGGGYQIAKELDEITVYEILEAVEKNLIPMECLYKETDCAIECDKCGTRGFWNCLWGSIESVVKEVSLDMLITQTKMYSGCSDIEYYI